MFARVILSCLTILLATGITLNAATIQIEKEPTELVKLRQSYQLSKKSTLQPIESRYQQDIATVEKLSTKRPELKKAITTGYEGEKNTALKKVNDKYVADLDALEKVLIQRRDLKGALVVQEEKKRILSGTNAPSALQSVSPAVVPKSPAAAAPKPGPFVYKSKTEGMAGAVGFSKNNIYKFNMTEVRANTKLTVYAAGRGSKNTYGEIYLITPTGQKARIYKWSPDDFKDSIKDVRSYKQLKPIKIMISGIVAGPGKYQVEFEWQKGIDPLIIKYVELLTW